MNSFIRLRKVAADQEWRGLPIRVPRYPRSVRSARVMDHHEHGTTSGVRSEDMALGYWQLQPSRDAWSRKIPTTSPLPSSLRAFGPSGRRTRRLAGADLHPYVASAAHDVPLPLGGIRGGTKPPASPCRGPAKRGPKG